MNSLLLLIVLALTRRFRADTMISGSPKSNFKTQRAAVRAWSELLDDSDYDNSKWGGPQYVFDRQAKRLSDLFESKNALVNFVLVGACDGTNDMTIRDRYLPNAHWRGVFVEPFTINFQDLHQFMEDHGVSSRTHIIQAAATSKCNSTTMKMKRPDFEETNKTLPHWMRRQIGAVVPWNKLDRPMTGGWVAEFVRCVTGDDILIDWATFINRDAAPPSSAAGGIDANVATPKKVAKMRAHVLKVDVEGHDYDVISGFLKDETPNSQLPLLISFEAKSIAGQFPTLKAKMESRGYVVSNYASDGFAILRGDRMLGTPSQSTPDETAEQRKAKKKSAKQQKKKRKAQE